MKITTITNTVLDDGTTNTQVVIETSRHQHDCGECLFMGCHKEYDLYFCTTNKDLIARYGELGDYISMRPAHLNVTSLNDDHPIQALAVKLRRLNLMM